MRAVELLAGEPAQMSQNIDAVALKCYDWSRAESCPSGLPAVEGICQAGMFSLASRRSYRMLRSHVLLLWNAGRSP